MLIHTPMCFKEASRRAWTQAGVSTEVCTAHLCTPEALHPPLLTD